ncbi:hypothetical protein VNI00_009291 [Paramarasmius palmivorus]|uniref:Cytochrome P450 n=1 Tax=Paramarasmius palmivorus TaxID=297713 RepID=A0AAW0CR10_9AGAR
MSLTVFICCVALLAAVWASRSKRRLSYPPGPLADLFFGHLRIIPTHNQAEIFHQWSQTYGEVMHLKVFNRNIIVLDTFEAAQDLLENRSANYSCRPNFVVWDMMGWRPNVSFTQYGKEFLKHRRVLQRFFGRKEILTFEAVVAEEARLLVENLLHAGPGEHLQLVHRFTISNILRVTFGKQIKADDDPFMKLAQDLSRVINNSGPIGNTPVDMFPWLRHFPSWFPGRYYGNMALAGHKTVRRLHDYPVDFVREQMRKQNVQRSFVSETLSDLGGDFDLEDIKGASAAIFSAGEDTTYATLVVFLLNMIVHPKYQERAYQEIVSVIGEGRLPESSDRQSLPFVECILQETLRWHPVTPLGIPHRSLEDDMYKDMFIPKGSIIVPNVHGMSLDKRVYSEPERFDPTRFLPTPDGRGEPYFPASWGFGRRICPGRHFANMSLWHAMACILATLEICPEKDVHGFPMMPEIRFTEGLVW